MFPDGSAWSCPIQGLSKQASAPPVWQMARPNGKARSRDHGACRETVSNSLVHTLRRGRELVEHPLQIEGSRLLAWREFGQRLDVIADKGLRRHQQKDAVDAPPGVSHAFEICALEGISAEIEQFGHPQGHHRVLPHVEAMRALFHEGKLPFVVAQSRQAAVVRPVEELL